MDTIGIFYMDLMWGNAKYENKRNSDHPQYLRLSSTTPRAWGLRDSMASSSTSRKHGDPILMECFERANTDFALKLQFSSYTQSPDINHG
ncbi:hypothetical protein RRG08_001434 [Elysia crispata]|uniref:Uncharacterized protein n=1 Tax=Elysia crispata TaxID=231223 RepID=A0AAE0ZQH7_9GAST|nr:hypothetical protein RRG08_001434 [Elysia crispata]